MRRRQALNRRAKMRLLDGYVARSNEAGEALKPLTINHTPTKSSHRPPGSVCSKFRLKPMISSTEPHRMVAYPTRPQIPSTLHQSRAVERVIQHQPRTANREHANVVGTQLRLREHATEALEKRGI
jgi:hypothetical protein